MKTILDLNIPSLATAAGHAAAFRVAQEMAPDLDANWWMNAGYAIEGRDVETDLQTLGQYVCSRPPMLTETVYRKADELELHRLLADNFEIIEPWVKAAYQSFHAATHAVFGVLIDAYNREKSVHALASRQALPHAATVQIPVSDTLMEQEADAMDMHEESEGGLSHPPETVDAAEVATTDPQPEIQTPRRKR